MHLLRNAAIQVINVVCLHWLRCLYLQQATLEHDVLSLTLETPGAGFSNKQNLGQDRPDSGLVISTFLALAFSVIWGADWSLHHMWGRWLFLSGKINSLVLCNLACSVWRRLRGDLIAFNSFLVRWKARLNTDLFSVVTSDRTEGMAWRCIWEV